jgi:hypothetical protein
MELERLNRTNCRSYGKTDQPSITVTTKNGVIGFSKGAIELIGLKLGDQVEFAIDKKDKSVFVLKSLKKEGFEIREHKSSKGFCFNNTVSAKRINELYAAEKQNVRYPLSLSPNNETGETMWLIINKQL